MLFFSLTCIISFDWSTLEHFCITWSHETLSVSLKTEASRAQTTNYHRFDSDSWEQLMKFNVKTHLIISPLSGLVTDMSEVSTKSRWSTHLRQYEITRIILPQIFVFLKRLPKQKSLLSHCLIAAGETALTLLERLFTGIRVKQTSSH